MARKHKGYSAKVKSRMFVVFLFFGIVIVTLFYTLMNNLCQINELNSKLRDLEVESVALLDEESVIEADIKRLSDPLYIARYAREKYFYSKPNELILRIED